MHLSAKFGVRRWSKYAEARSPELENITRFAIHDFDPELMRLSQQSANFVVRNSFRQPQFARTEIADDCRHSAHVVGASMRERDRVNMRNSARPEIRRDHVFADIHLRMGPERQAACVHHQGFSIGERKEKRIAQANVNRRHFQYAGTKLRMRRKNPDPHPASGKYCGSGKGGRPLLPHQHSTHAYGDGSKTRLPQYWALVRECLPVEGRRATSQFRRSLAAQYPQLGLVF